MPYAEPDYSKYDWDAELKRGQEYIKALKVKLNQWFGSDPLIGEEINHPVADGYARYIVASVKPFSLIHIPFGDGYSAGAIWERGITLKDARKMIEMNKQFKSIFDR
jgi:hypothetical protein